MVCSFRGLGCLRDGTRCTGVLQHDVYFLFSGSNEEIIVHTGLTINAVLCGNIRSISHCVQRESRAALLQICTHRKRRQDKEAKCTAGVLDTSE